MHPYFFGDSDKHLYGVYDAPMSNGVKSTGVLLCYPIGQEYMRSHWASRQLVSQLCRAGMHCMRFDYFGSGDSAGTSTDASLDQWQADITTGLTELKDIADVSKVSLIGLRLGATIAATTRLQNKAVNKLVLWDPVVNGTTYLDELRNMHQSLLGNLKNLHNNRTPHQSQGVEEILGFRYADSLITEIRALNLLELTEFSAEKIVLIVSEPKSEYDQLREHLNSLNLLIGYQEISSNGAWNDLAEIENALIASEAINAITSELRK